MRSLLFLQPCPDDIGALSGYLLLRPFRDIQFSPPQIPKHRQPHADHSPIHRSHRDRRVIDYLDHHVACGAREHARTHKRHEIVLLQPEAGAEAVEEEPEIEYEYRDKREYAGLHANLQVHVMRLCHRLGAVAAIVHRNKIVVRERDDEGVRAGTEDRVVLQERDRLAPDISTAGERIRSLLIKLTVILSPQIQKIIITNNKRFLDPVPKHRPNTAVIGRRPYYMGKSV